MLSRVLSFFAKRGKQLAGSDKAGNTYYRQFNDIDGTVKERRWVEFGGSSVVELIPVEWNSWLNGRRKEPPTPEEMMEFEARRNAIKAKVALLEKEEEKRRYRAKALQQGINGDDLSPHTMTRYLQQVTESDVPVQQNDDSKVVQKVGDSEPKFEPEAWNPSLPSKK